MNKEQKIRFIKEVCTHLENYMLEKVEIMPEEWDGHELRQMFADVVQERWNNIPIGGKRKRTYNETVLTKNLF